MLPVYYWLLCKYMNLLLERTGGRYKLYTNHLPTQHNLIAGTKASPPPTLRIHNILPPLMVTTALTRRLRGGSLSYCHLPTTLTRRRCGLLRAEHGPLVGTRADSRNTCRQGVKSALKVSPSLLANVDSEWGGGAKQVSPHPEPKGGVQSSLQSPPRTQEGGGVLRNHC